MKKMFFRDSEGCRIHDGQRVYFFGEFPTKQKIFDETMYKKYGVKHPREGIVLIDGDRLCFVTTIHGKIQATGLYWELDGEPCYDLIIIN